MWDSKTPKPQMTKYTYGFGFDLVEPGDTEPTVHTVSGRSKGEIG